MVRWLTVAKTQRPCSKRREIPRVVLLEVCGHEGVGSCFCFVSVEEQPVLLVGRSNNLTAVEGLSRLKYVTCNFIPNVQLSTSTVTFTSSENMDDTASHSLNSWQ